MTHFRDHFSRHARAYARHRPTYPEELYDQVVAPCRERQLAWDCATGNGQVATRLAADFENVVATDASRSQVEHAFPRAGVVYAVAPAETPPLSTACVDLITVGQALHWFEWEAFFREVQRVLKPGGVLAVWGYGVGSLDAAIDPLLLRFHGEILGPYWPVRAHHLQGEYRDIPFPLEPLPTTPVTMAIDWALPQLIEYLGTWSAVQRYRDHRGIDPVGLIRDELAAWWGDPARARPFAWPLVLKLGRNRG